MSEASLPLMPPPPPGTSEAQSALRIRGARRRGRPSHQVDLRRLCGRAPAEPGTMLHASMGVDRQSLCAPEDFSHPAL